MTCTVVYRAAHDAPEVTLTYPSDRLDELLERADKRFCDPLTAEDLLRFERAKAIGLGKKKKKGR